MIRVGLLLGLAGIALFCGLIAYNGLADVGALLMTAGWGLIWASLFHVVPMLANGIAWQVLFVGAKPPATWRMTYAVWVRESVNGLLPVARVGGEFVSFRVLTAMGFRPIPVAASLISDISLALVSQFIFTVGGLVLLLIRFENAAVVWRVTGGLMIFLPMVGGIFAVQRIGIVAIVSGLVGTLFGDRWGELVGNAARLDRALRLVYRRASRVIAALLWQLLGWLLGAGEVWLTLGFLGHPIDLYDAVLLESVAQAISSAAFVVPGALGVQEGGFLVVGAMVGLDPQAALALALARRVRDLLIFVPGLAAWQIGETRRLLGGSAARRSPHRQA